MPTIMLRTRSSVSAAIIIGALLGADPGVVQGQLRVARIIGSGMVIQRDVPVPAWGWATPGERIIVTLGGRSDSATAGADGSWRVTLPARPAGGPYEMVVAGRNERLILRDILVGDVWVASGQSNMEWTVANAKNAPREIAAANDLKIRHFKVPQSYAESPESDLAGGAWEAADSVHVGGFTAVGYFFARELRPAIGVPIGIVNTTWGGSRVEPWMSRETLGLTDEKWSELRRTQRDVIEQMRAALERKTGPLPATDPGLVDGRALWADPMLDESAWTRIDVPGPWEQAGYEGMDGVAWYRTAFSLTAEEAKNDLRLGLGAIDDSDISWVNGVQVGRTDNQWDKGRLYDVPAAALRGGRNVIAVRVEDFQGGGGIHGDPGALYVDVGGERRPLAGLWRFKVGAASVMPEGLAINHTPTLLYNKMVHPLLSLPVKGFIWYQGESNADNYEEAVAYRPLFADLITSWRRAWRQPDAPFLWVQLASFMAVDSQPPARSPWATLRESQHAALILPNTAEAITIDLGETNDIHPRNKQDVGRRLALGARAVAYGQKVTHAGPAYRRHQVRDGRVLVDFDHTGGLVARGDSLGGFAIAGADRKWHWASARIEDGRVAVWSPAVPKPVAVRYAWTNNPIDAGLYDSAGLPAAPFRTDAW